METGSYLQKKKKKYEIKTLIRKKDKIWLNS